VYDALDTMMKRVIPYLYDRRYLHKDIARHAGINPATLNRIRSSPETGYKPKYETLVSILSYFDALEGGEK